jgi:hypothetical protein
MLFLYVCSKYVLSKQEGTEKNQKIISRYSPFTNTYCGIIYRLSCNAQPIWSILLHIQSYNSIPTN